MPARRYVAAAQIRHHRRVGPNCDPGRLPELQRAQSPVALHPVEDRLPVRDDEIRLPSAKRPSGFGSGLRERTPQTRVEHANLTRARGGGGQRFGYRRPQPRFVRDAARPQGSQHQSVAFEA